MAILIDHESVIAKLKILEDTENLSELEKVLNINRGGLSAYLKRKSLPLKEISLYCLERNIEINYVLGKKVTEK